MTIQRGDMVRVVKTVNSGTRKDPVGMTGTVIRPSDEARRMTHVRLHMPEGEDSRVYPDLFFEEELELEDTDERE